MGNNDKLIFSSNCRDYPNDDILVKCNAPKDYISFACSCTDTQSTHIIILDTKDAIKLAKRILASQTDAGKILYVE